MIATNIGAKAKANLAGSKLSRNAKQSWLLLLAINIVMLAIVFYADQRITQESHNIFKISNEIDALHKLHVDVLKMESNERVFIITGNLEYSNSHKLMISNLLKDVKNLESLLSIYPSLSNSLSELIAHIKYKVEFSEANADARTQSFSDALDRVNTLAGKREMDAIIRLINTLDEDRKKSRDEWRQQRVKTLASLKFSLGGMFLTLALVMYYFYRQSVILAASQREAESLTRYIATHDALTDLPNRKMLLDELNRMLSRAQRHGSLCALLFLDLNGFKKVNDTFGHLAGDELLVQVAERLKALMRSSEMAARLGGDEFIVVMEDVKAHSDVGIVKDKILVAVSTPFVLSNSTVKISTSIGVAMFPDDAVEASDLLQFADTAMYEVKRARQLSA